MDGQNNGIFMARLISKFLAYEVVDHAMNGISI